MTESVPTSDLSQNQPQKITVMLADDHPLLRQALRNILEKQTDLEIIAEVDDGEQAVRVATELAPQVVIMDISMPRLNGLEATRQIKARRPDIAILVLTVHDDSEHILGILEAGAAGYLTKRVFGHEVVQAVRAVVAGETVLSSVVSRQVIRHALYHITKPVPLDIREKISSRELEILRLAARGLSNKEIALTLELSSRTIKSYLSEIFSKFNVGNRTEAVITALRAGILTMSDLE